jgi:hypothetical protein
MPCSKRWFCLGKGPQQLLRRKAKSSAAVFLTKNSVPSALQPYTVGKPSRTDFTKTASRAALGSESMSASGQISTMGRDRERKQKRDIFFMEVQVVDADEDAVSTFDQMINLSSVVNQ